MTDNEKQKFRYRILTQELNRYEEKIMPTYFTHYEVRRNSNRILSSGIYTSDTLIKSHADYCRFVNDVCIKENCTDKNLIIKSLSLLDKR